MEVIEIEEVKKKKVAIAEDLKQQLSLNPEVEKQVILHFLAEGGTGSYIRIWPSSFLFDANSDHISRLIHVEGISLYPVWAPCHHDHQFTLVFEGLPKECTLFHFEEICHGQGGGFKAGPILRNKTDVYFLKISLDQ